MDIDFLWDRKKDVPEDVPVTAKSTERPRVALNGSGPVFLASRAPTALRPANKGVPLTPAQN